MSVLLSFIFVFFPPPPCSPPLGAAAASVVYRGQLLRRGQAPAIVIELLRNDHPPGGAGEASVPGVAPALAGAIHAATGQRPRRLPLIADGWEFT